MMMKKKFVAVALSAVCLLSAVSCGQQSASTASSASSVSSSVASSASASQVMDAEDYLSGISGTYVELFPEMAKSEYRNLWIDAATPLVGEDNAESATDMLLGMCMAEPYGEEAVEKYAADPDSTAFNCYFLGGVEKFVMNGDTITGLDAQGQEVFAHTYQKLDVDNENSFLFYQSEDADSGEFTYFHMMMKKKFVAVALSAVCLLSAVSCGQQSASTASSASSVSSSVASSASASQVMDAEDYLSGISGTYVELFPEMAKSEYRNLWIDAATPLVGEDNAESATDMLLGMCMAEPYGEEAVEKYAADPDSTAFNCYFLGGVEKFVMNGDTITGLDAQGQEVFAHTYQKLDVDNENSFLFYQSEDADSGEFTYFAFAPDTMETTYHLEFRYAEDLDDLQSWYEGNYAYWNAAAIAEDYDQATMENVIELFVTENLSEAE